MSDHNSSQSKCGYVKEQLGNTPYRAGTILSGESELLNKRYIYECDAMVEGPSGLASLPLRSPLPPSTPNTHVHAYAHAHVHYVALLCHSSHKQ